MYNLSTICDINLSQLIFSILKVTVRRNVWHWQSKKKPAVLGNGSGDADWFHALAEKQASWNNDVCCFRCDYKIFEVNNEYVVQTQNL